MDAVKDPAIVRLGKRIALFKRRGCATERAGELAELLLLRDADRDDRRMCIECAHLQTTGGCFAARQGWIHGTAPYLTPVKDMLQRCECFEWQKP
ncbi:MAG: hypothetical protein Q7T70_02700 [Polaromonas sp.]|nr:hypothetical protein [Polaromonas sp.]